MNFILALCKFIEASELVYNELECLYFVLFAPVQEAKAG